MIILLLSPDCLDRGWGTRTVRAWLAAEWPWGGSRPHHYRASPPADGPRGPSGGAARTARATLKGAWGAGSCPHR